MKYRASFVAVTLIIVLALTSTRGDLPGVMAQGPHQIGLVIAFGDGTLVTHCIEETGISGYEVLQRAGLDLVTSFDSGMGAGVCKIEDEGCPQHSCLTCDVPNYWSYWHLDGESWVYSQRGASSHIVQSGDVEGWRWGAGNPPPVLPLEEICAPPATDTPVPTETPFPPSSTPIPPTDTPAPTSEPTPEVWFRLDDNPVSTGSCTTLRWDTSHAQEAYLDGEPVSVTGTRQVCPNAPTDYELRVVGMEEEATYQLTLGVTGSTATATASALPTATRAPSTPTVNQPAATEPTASPTIRGGASPTTPSTETVRSSSAPEASTATLTPLPSSTPPPWTIRPDPSSTPDQVVEAESSNGQGDALEEPAPVSPFVPVSYIAFSLIVGGLVGWLIYILRFRR